MVSPLDTSHRRRTHPCFCVLPIAGGHMNASISSDCMVRSMLWSLLRAMVHPWLSNKRMIPHQCFRFVPLHMTRQCFGHHKVQWYILCSLPCAWTHINASLSSHCVLPHERFGVVTRACTPPSMGPSLLPVPGIATIGSTPLSPSLSPYILFVHRTILLLDRGFLVRHPNKM